jgi:hypothetical protein
MKLENTSNPLPFVESYTYVAVSNAGVAAAFPMESLYGLGYFEPSVQERLENEEFEMRIDAWLEGEVEAGNFDEMARQALEAYGRGEASEF